MSYRIGIELSENHRGKAYTKKEAFEKVYIIKSRGKGSSSYICVPKVLIGLRVRLIEVKKESVK